ncbi:MAG: Carbon monoxide dehydrogenase subunit (CoxG) [Pseudonocardiales bacterium]|nr:Carbon monoxide dehydrogenase subunit (CoxG) [Pseudonocardiales bacterium]
MKVSGNATLHAPIERVWTALNDPAVLVRTIPGCERLESTGPDSYRMVVTAGVASIKGTYAGEVQLSDQKQPDSFLMTASGAGGPGTVSTEVRVCLADAGDGSTTLTYDADAVVGGVVAGVGQRMLVGVAKKMAGEFFSSVDDVLTGRIVEPVSAGPATAEPGVFVAPPRPVRPAGGDGFLRGAIVGAAIALAGVAVGGLLGRRWH